MELNHKKYTVLAVLDEVYRRTDDLVLRVEVANAALALRNASEDEKDHEFISAYQQGRILAKRHQHLCLSTSSKPTTGATP